MKRYDNVSLAIGKESEKDNYSPSGVSLFLNEDTGELTVREGTKNILSRSFTPITQTNYDLLEQPITDGKLYVIIPE